MTEIIEKEARKSSQDPVQEALRQHKDSWNHEASLLIAQLIAFKRGLNGRGEPKIGLPPSSIKDPLPSEVGNYLDQLSDRYNKLISDAHSIIDEQANYSLNRNKGSKENNQQVTSFDKNENIVKIASWWGSRAKTYAKNSYVNPWYWFAAKEEIKVRMKLLKISTDFVEKLKNIDGFVVSKDNKAIPNSIYEFDKFISSFDQLIFPNMEKLIKIEKILLSQEPIQDEKIELKDTPQIINEKHENLEEKKSINNIEKNNLQLSGEESKYALGLTPKEMIDDVIFTGPISVIMQKFYPEEKKIFQLDSDKLRKKLDQYILSETGNLEDIQIDYANLLKLSNSILKLNSKNFNLQLKEIEKLFNNKSASISVEFEKFASNFMSRWLKRQKLKILSDSEDRVRLVASNKIQSLLKAFDAFQNSLENDEQSLDFIMNKFETITNKISKLGETLYYLGKTHNDEYEQARLNGKPTTHLIKQEVLNKLLNSKKYFDAQISKINL